jgi:hypothetical protein
MEKETKIINWEQVFNVHHRIVSVVQRVEFVSDKVLRRAVVSCVWCAG